MKVQRLAGPDAGVLKYDILTALSVSGLAGTPGFCTTLMRLIALVTARYNWREDEFCVGQRDMARMWSVDERTVKRQIKRLMDAEILVCRRPGVRGRVGAYRLNQRAIARLSEPVWHLVGPDFEKRMQERYRTSDVTVVRLDGYSRLDTNKSIPSIKVGATPWQRAMIRLERSDKAQFDAWFRRLAHLTTDAGIITLTCPSVFIQRYIETHLMQPLLTALEGEFGKIRSVIFQV